MADKPVNEKEEVQAEALTAVNAALESLAAADKVDDAALESIDGALQGMNESTRRAVLDLPAFQSIIAKAAEQAQGSNEPGSYKQVGAFTMKVPYTVADLYRIWGTVENYVHVGKNTVVTPGGWTFYLNDGIQYDIPRNTPMEKIPEGHGIVLPGIVIQILNESRAATREARRETDTGAFFGQGVRFIGPGWAGKETVIREPVVVPADTPTDQ